MTTPFGEGRANLEGQARIYHRELGRSVLALHLLDEVSQVKVDRVVESALYLGMPQHPKHAVLRFLARTPVRSFVLMPIVVVAFEISWGGGTLAFEPWGLPLLAWGYLQYRLAGRFRTARGGGGPGINVPPTRIVTEGIYRFTRNPMYLGHMIFFVGLAITFRSIFALALLTAPAMWFHRRVLADEARLTAQFGTEYREYMGRVKRWVPGLG